MAQKKKMHTAIVVIAIFQLVFGGLGLIGPVMYFAGGQKVADSLTASLPKSPGQPDLSQEKLEKGILKRVPWYNTFQNAMNGAGLLICFMMIASGIGLLGMHQWARWLAILYVFLSIAYTLTLVVFTLRTLAPMMGEVMKEQFQTMPKATGPGALDPQVLANIMQMSMIVSAVIMLLILIYPIIVFIIMFLPSVRAAFRGVTVPTEPEDYDDRPADAEDLDEPDERFRKKDY